MIDSKLILENFEWLSKLYPGIEEFYKQGYIRGFGFHHVAIQFSFKRMETLLSNPGYIALFEHFYKQVKEELVGNDRYALDQMLKITQIYNLFASKACPSSINL